MRNSVTGRKEALRAPLLFTEEQATHAMLVTNVNTDASMNVNTDKGGETANVDNNRQTGSGKLHKGRGNGHHRALQWYMCGPTVYDDAHIGHARTVSSEVNCCSELEHKCNTCHNIP